MINSEQDKELDAQIRAAGLTAPRVMPEHIDDLVDALSFHTYVIPGTTVTVAAALTAGNIVVAVAEAGAASAENFNEVIGRNRAISRVKDAARLKLWELEGYRLKRNLLDLQEVGGLENVLAFAASMPAEHAGEWPVTAIPGAVICAARKSCGYLSARADACQCPGGPCSLAVGISSSSKCSCAECLDDVLDQLSGKPGGV